MKRVISYPPVVILLDILFVFLFVLILSSSKENIQITIPKDKLFDEAKILLIQNNQYYEYNTNSKEITLFELPDRFNKFIDCENQKECIEAKNKFGQNKEFVILLPKHIFENISKVAMIAFSNKTCKELHFDIKQDASFDKEELLKENKCLADISGFKENF
jgi:biopolymer transport protein ExbD